MKRFWKIIFTTLGIIAGVGVASILLGSMFGGAAQAVALVRQEALESAVYVCPSVPGADYLSRTGHESEDAIWHRLAGEMADSGYPLIEEQHYEDMEAGTAAGIREISVEAGHCSLIIKETEQDSYGIVADNIHALQYYTEEGELVIRANHSRKKEAGDSTLVLYIPKTGSVNEMELELGAGVLQAEGLKTDCLSIEAGAGEFIIDGLQAEEAEIETGLGRGEISAGEVTDMVIEAGMGGFFYQGAIRGDVEASCAMGTIRMTVAGRKDDFDYDIECAAGSTVIRDKDDALETGIGRHSFDNGAEREMQLSCAMGSIEIEFEENGGEEYEQ